MPLILLTFITSLDVVFGLLNLLSHVVFWITADLLTVSDKLFSAHVDHVI